MHHIKNSTQSLIKTGLQILPKNLQFQRAKRVKLAQPTEVLKTSSSVAEKLLNVKGRSLESLQKIEWRKESDKQRLKKKGRRTKKQQLAWFCLRSRKLSAEERRHWWHHRTKPLSRLILDKWKLRVGHRATEKRKRRRKGWAAVSSEEDKQVPRQPRSQSHSV